MITHIVLFKFKDDTTKIEIEKAKNMIEALNQSVPTLEKIEVGINFADEGRAMDMSLIATFIDREGLDEYAQHPVHLEVISYIKSIADYTKVVDYETQD